MKKGIKDSSGKEISVNRQYKMAGISRGALYYICKGEKKRDLSAMRKMDEFYLDHPSKVWQTDISYIPMADGFIYLVAIIDVYSRAILAWKLAMTLADALYF